jgi:hypothetical protein
MPPKDADALAVWDAKARTLIDRIDAVLGETEPRVSRAAVDDPITELVHRVIARTPPPAGEILSPVPSSEPSAWQTSRPTGQPTNMGHQPDRIDHWDAYVCRFDSEGAED